MNPVVEMADLVQNTKPRSRGDEPMGEEVELAATDKTPLTRG